MRRGALLLVVLGLAGCREKEVPPAPAKSWQLLASELPSALLSVTGRSANDIYAVGADKGHGPLVLHYDGTKWKELHTGTSGDLWWVHAFANGPVLLAGASGTVLRYDGAKFERLDTPGLGKQTVYGVWGTSASDFYAVGSAGGRNGFVWHFAEGKFTSEKLPRDLPRLKDGEVPGFFKAWGRDDEVWVVGGAGTLLHRKGKAPFTIVPTTTKDTLFTVHGTADHVVAVGGAGNGVAFTGSASGAVRESSPPNAGILQGIFASSTYGDWATGERGAIWHRDKSEAAFVLAEQTLPIPAGSSLHSVFVDSAGGVWSAGGNVLTPALDNGMLVHYGAPMGPIVIEEDAPAPKSATPDAGVATCPAPVVAIGREHSIARRWDEQILAAIRLDLPRPPIHARNLFHLSAGMWDAWAGYDTKAHGLFVNERHTDANVDHARTVAISFAAYRILAKRYSKAASAPTTQACLRAVMDDLKLDPSDTHDTGDDPIAFGNRVAKTILETGAADGANEAGDYADTSWTDVNPPLVYDAPGTTLKDPAKWQPINLSVAATQNGIILPAGIQGYIGAQWGTVTPFAMAKNGRLAKWPSPGPTPMPGKEMKDWVVEVIAKTAAVDPTNPETIDISPGKYGHNALGTNDGKGWEKNPVTNAPYAPQIVKRADFARVMAEFWADGPKSETPPGHWNVLANMSADAPGFARKLFGTGASLDPLAWDVHVYLALNGAEHDAAIAAWGIKRETATIRPLSLVRAMGAKGQSSDPAGPSFDPDGLPLVPDLVEVITNESSAPGQRHEHLSFFVGQVAVKNWLGEPGDRSRQVSGVGWVRAVDWGTYQRRTFVTPAFPAFISGHSTFSRAGAEVLAALTGSPYFPGGLAEFVAPKDVFLTFEKGPTADIHLQWASFFDASDQAGQSRLWGSIHLPPDDFSGRRVGHQVGLDAVARSRLLFDGR